MKEIVMLVMGWRSQKDELDQHKDNIRHKQEKYFSTEVSGIMQLEWFLGWFKILVLGKACFCSCEPTLQHYILNSNNGPCLPFILHQ